MHKSTFYRFFVALALTLSGGITSFVEAQNATTKTQDMPVTTGAYEPTWESLSAWQCPEWFRDAKFGIWAHWGPQCESEDGDWYARFMYYEGSGQFDWHISHFGRPDVFGLKDLCNAWKADQWDPQALIDLYYSVGARYFMTLGNHHDNFDLWDSPYQEWNAVNIGPKRDIVKGWSDACKKYGLPFGVSMHASHAWTWLEPSQDWDGNLTKEDGYVPNADGTAKWWKGLDPQALYAQRHTHSAGWDDSGVIHSQWDWGNGASLPDAAYKQKFQNRVLQCVRDYAPDMLYFDDTVLPFWGCDESVGLNILTDFYNASARQHSGQQQVVVMGKQLREQHKHAMLWDVERGAPDRAQELPWQTCTCLGQWHYDINNTNYKSAQQVVDFLIDVVAKNGNLLLSVPLRANGTIDDKERVVLDGIKAWMDINSESIYGTRPWTVYGEGPLFDTARPLNAQGFNEGNDYSDRDVRYVQKDGKVYATILRWPATHTFTFKAFGPLAKTYPGAVRSCTLLGHGTVSVTSDVDGVTVEVPDNSANAIAPVYVFTFDSEHADMPMKQVLRLYEDKVATFASTAGYNTGNWNAALLADFSARLEQARTLVNADEVTRLRTLRDLANAYATLCADGRVPAGNPAPGAEADLTADALVETSSFSRKDDPCTRFAAPLHWTVDNFTIPNGGDGIKQGLDNYPGHDCLMLGVWDDGGRNEDGDLTDARIYRTVTLQPGRYFFGARYQTTYNLTSHAYIFAADAPYSTADLPRRALAYYPINACPDHDTAVYGLYFDVPSERDVTLGWQADLRNGNAQQEVRVDEVYLYYYGDINRTRVHALADTIDAHLAALPYDTNTGHYAADSPAAVAVHTLIDEARALPADADYGHLSSIYAHLGDAYNTFLTEAQNEGGLFDEIGAEDITTLQFAESHDFARADPSDTRYGAPRDWTVEHYSYDMGGDGTRGGIDGYSGHDCLSLGIWYDRPSEADFTDARVFHAIHLTAGRYFFGTALNALYQLGTAYIFASSAPLATADIPSRGVSHYPLMRCAIDDDLRGIYFTLDTESDLVLGFQADMQHGYDAQEFRVDRIGLYVYPSDSPTAITDWSASRPYTERIDGRIYALDGRYVGTEAARLQRGVYVRDGHKFVR